MEDVVIVPSKKKRSVPLDLIFMITVFLIFFVTLLMYVYLEDFDAVYAYCRNAWTQTKTWVSHKLVTTKLKFSPVFASSYSTLYPPHYHLLKDKERLCYENCYQHLLHIRPSLEQNKHIRHERPELPITLQERWNLNVALKTHYTSVWNMAIRNVAVSLLQYILLWSEAQPKKKCQNAATRKEKEEEHNERVQDTFAALFKIGNAIIHEQQDIIPHDPTVLNAQLHEPIYPTFISPIHKQTWSERLINPIDVSHMEKFARVQYILSWMIWKFTPQTEIQGGECKRFLLQDISSTYQVILFEFFTETLPSSFEKEIVNIITDWLF